MFTIIIVLVVGLVFALIPQVVYVVVKGVCLLTGNTVSYAPFGYAALAILLIWILLFAYGNMVGRFRYEIKTVEIIHSDLPEAFDGYRIVHISDLHLDGWRGKETQLQHIVDEINALEADAVCFTGDIVSLSPAELKPFVPILRQLKAKDGVHSVLGNHDYLPYARVSAAKRLDMQREVIRMQREELGWNLLLNENRVIRHANDSIYLLGGENQSVGAHPVVQRGNLKQTLRGVPSDGSLFCILLSHDPSQWRKEVLPLTNIQLTLSGHTHAMQFRVLGFTPSRWAYPECDGLYTESGRYLYVNIGLGGTMPMRIGATPEITVLKLKR